MGNPRIQFVAAWETNIPPKGGDAGDHAASGLTKLKVASGAREWFSVGVDTAVARCNSLWGPALMTTVPESLINKPYDVMGSKPKANALSRLWLHQEQRPGGYIKASDNSWWSSNLKATWANTFNPTGFKLLAGFEWPNSGMRRDDWQTLSIQSREVKQALQTKLGLDPLLPVQRIGWLQSDYHKIKELIVDAGLVEFDTSEGMRLGVKGQGESMV